MLRVLDRQNLQTMKLYRPQRALVESFLLILGVSLECVDLLLQVLHHLNVMRFQQLLLFGGDGL